MTNYKRFADLFAATAYAMQHGGRIELSEDFDAWIGGPVPPHPLPHTHTPPPPPPPPPGSARGGLWGARVFRRGGCGGPHPPPPQKRPTPPSPPPAPAPRPG